MGSHRGASEDPERRRRGWRVRARCVSLVPAGWRSESSVGPDTSQSQSALDGASCLRGRLLPDGDPKISALRLPRVSWRICTIGVSLPSKPHHVRKVSCWMRQVSLSVRTDSDLRISGTWTHGVDRGYDCGPRSRVLLDCRQFAFTGSTRSQWVHLLPLHRTVCARA